jgi:radical SAM enzyme (TIGR01210 family)
MLTKIAETPAIQLLVIESLPQYINTESLKKLRSILPEITIEIGIGMETANRQINTLCVNKPFGKSLLISAIQCMKTFKIRPLIYVMIKPSFLRESEALTDAQESVRFAFSAGAAVVSLEPVNASEHNMAGNLERCGLRRPPWLWTIVEIVRRCSSLGSIRIGGEQFAPSYSFSARNCGICDPLFRQRFRLYNQTQDVHAFDDLHCDCEHAWRKELAEEIDSLPDWVDKCIDKMQPREDESVT